MITSTPPSVRRFLPIVLASLVIGFVLVVATAIFVNYRVHTTGLAL